MPVAVAPLASSIARSRWSRWWRATARSDMGRTPQHGQEDGGGHGAAPGVRARAMAEVDPEQAAALRRLRAAVGFVEVLRIIDHAQDDDELIEDGEQALPADR
jgi:hypothetical protein